MHKQSNAEVLSFKISSYLSSSIIQSQQVLSSRYCYIHWKKNWQFVTLNNTSSPCAQCCITALWCASRICCLVVGGSKSWFGPGQLSTGFGKEGMCNVSFCVVGDEGERGCVDTTQRKTQTSRPFVIKQHPIKETLLRIWIGHEFHWVIKQKCLICSQAPWVLSGLIKLIHFEGMCFCVRKRKKIKIFVLWGLQKRLQQKRKHICLLAFIMCHTTYTALYISVMFKIVQTDICS